MQKLAISLFLLAPPQGKAEERHSDRADVKDGREIGQNYIISPVFWPERLKCDVAGKGSLKGQ